MRFPVRLGAWQALAVFIVVWIGTDVTVQLVSDQLLTHLGISGVRQSVAVQALCNAGLMWVMLVVCILLLRSRGQTLADIGWRRTASPRAWYLALAVAIVFSGLALGSVRDSARLLLSDWSLYRISLGLLIGISAGVCLEAIFRGFVMAQARDAGLPVTVQVILSAVLFGLALMRVGWRGSAVHTSFWVHLAATPAPTILGAALAIIYIVGRRSLTPAIVAHAVIDLIVEPGMLILAASGGHLHA